MPFISMDVHSVRSVLKLEHVTIENSQINCSMSLREKLI